MALRIKSSWRKFSEKNESAVTSSTSPTENIDRDNHADESACTHFKTTAVDFGSCYAESRVESGELGILYLFLRTKFNVTLEQFTYFNAIGITIKMVGCLAAFGLFRNTIVSLAIPSNEIGSKYQTHCATLKFYPAEDWLHRKRKWKKQTNLNRMLPE
ncbi:unnamed protein product [Ceratitis capitata]|uniref:(Mediterranean fruit fly) hypothetical protein n=1 Tax=Ceratitis capitata TaxID=7213 RepID=A0A811VGK6_CERCA|nr:unnamed protein product [Ceratitis capitata]